MSMLTIKTASLSPPLPSSSSKATATSDGTTTTTTTSSNNNKKNTKNRGQYLLTLLRSIERKKNTNEEKDETIKEKKEEEEEEELIVFLKELSNTIQRLGLFHNNNNNNNDSKRAEEIQKSLLVISTDKGGSGGSGGSGKKGRKRKKGGGGINNNLLLFDTNDQMEGSGSASSAAASEEEILILTALSRIFGIGKSTTTLSESSYVTPIVIQAAADTLLSIYQHATTTTTTTTNTCAAVELNLLSLQGSKLLVGLMKTASTLLTSLSNNNKDEESSSSSSVEQAIASCLRTSSSIILLLGTTLSRNTATLTLVKSTAWSCLNLLSSSSTSSSTSSSSSSSCDVIKAASILLSTLPFAGNTNGDDPSDLYSELVYRVTSLLGCTLRSFFPVRKFTLGQQQQQKHNKTSEEEEQHEAWIQSIQNTTTTSSFAQSARMEAFTCRIHNLSLLLITLLRLDACSYSNNEEYIIIFQSAAALPLKDILNTIETMLAFPTASEAKYNNTRPRLRDTIMEDGGLLSPKSAVGVSNFVKVVGYDLFRVVLSCLRSGGGGGGAGAALEYGRRITRMALSGLQSSCSRVLRRALEDPSILVSSGGEGGGGGGGGKMRRRWLHASIPLRAKAVRSIQDVILTLKSNCVVVHSDVVGSSGVGSGGNHYNTGGAGTAGGSMGKAIVLVCGCLLEQISFQEEEEEEKGEGDGNTMTTMVVDSWGTLGERVDLIDACAETLASCVATCGGYIPPNLRSTIDSVTSTCLSTLVSNVPTLSTSYASTKASFLRLGINCVCAPWSDGGTSCLVGIVRKVAAILKSDVDNAVSSTAHSALCVMDALMVPRAPPMLIVSRSGGMERGLSSSSILEGIQMVRNAEVAEREQKRKERKLNSEKGKTEEKEKKKARLEADNNKNILSSSTLKETPSHTKKNKDSTNVDDSNESKEKQSPPTEDKAEQEREVPGTTNKMAQDDKNNSNSNDNCDTDTMEVDKESITEKEKNEDPTRHGVSSMTNDHMESEKSTEKVANDSAFQADNDGLVEENAARTNEDFASEGGKGDDDTDDDEAFPEIVDCEPDEDDL